MVDIIVSKARINKSGSKLSSFKTVLRDTYTTDTTIEGVMEWLSYSKPVTNDIVYIEISKEKS